MSKKMRYILCVYKGMRTRSGVDVKKKCVKPLVCT